MTDVQQYDFCNDTIKLKETIEQSFLTLGERLKQIRDHGLYHLAWESFDDFCLELDISKGTASRLIGIYEMFIIQFPQPVSRLTTAKGWSGLAEVLPLIKTKEDCEFWISEWENLGSSDFRIKAREAKSGINQETCLHDDSYTLRVCRTCKHREQIFETK